MRAFSSAGVMRPPKVWSACSSRSGDSCSLIHGPRIRACAAARSPCRQKSARKGECTFGRSGSLRRSRGWWRGPRPPAKACPRRGGGTSAHAANSGWRRRRRDSGRMSRRCFRYGKSPIRRACGRVGSSIRLSMSVASCDRPRRANSRACLTVAMSRSEKLPLGAEGASSRGRRQWRTRAGTPCGIRQRLALALPWPERWLRGLDAVAI